MAAIQRAAAAAAFATLLLAQTATAAEEVTFIAFGDMPYTPEDEKTIDELSARFAAEDYPFIVHYGDVIRGNVPCKVEDLRMRKTRIYQLLEGRVFFTPGDNDWADCESYEESDGSRLQSAPGRLAKLREIFFSPDDLPSQSDWKIARLSPGYPENARWQLDGVTFVTLHVIGTENGRCDYSRDWTCKDYTATVDQEALDAVDNRDEANLSWLSIAFSKAREDEASALVVFMHANPNNSKWPKHPPCSRARQTKCAPFSALIWHLKQEAAAFDRPVLLIHGSTNPFCLDRVFGGEQAEKLWRLNGPGDYAYSDAAVVTVARDEPEPFRIKSLLNGRGVSAC